MSTSHSGTVGLFNSMLKEFKHIFTDQGVLLLAIIVPLLYPLLYSWIYTEETTREVPVCVVDMSRSESSRSFINKLDATPDIEVAFLCNDMKEAERKMAEQKAYGIIYFPSDYATRTARMEQTTISAYMDMSFMLYYKAIYVTMTNLVLENNSKIQLEIAHNTTRHEDELQQASIKIEEVQMYNTTGGYGNFLLQAVLIIIIQQTLLISVSMRAGWNRQRGMKGKLPGTSSLKEFFSVTSAFGLVYLFSSAYVLLITPKIFGFTQRIGLMDFAILVVPMLFAMLCFAMAISTFIKNREDSMVCLVFASIPMLFLVGVSWPEASIPPVWETLAWLIPSTPAGRAFVQLNEMGCPIEQVYPYLAALLAQGLFYMLVYFLRQWQIANQAG